jgi:hypothetical protein
MPDKALIVQNISPTRETRSGLANQSPAVRPRPAVVTSSEAAAGTAMRTEAAPLEPAATFRQAVEVAAVATRSAVAAFDEAAFELVLAVEAPLAMSQSPDWASSRRSDLVRPEPSGICSRSAQTSPLGRWPAPATCKESCTPGLGRCGRPRQAAGSQIANPEWVAPPV